jgi:GAF domain-containing protein
MRKNTSKDPLYSLMTSVTKTAPSNGMVRRGLQAIRAHLGMDVAYISEFVGNQTVFRDVDAPGLENRIKVGDSYSHDDIYCRHILEGRLPQLIADTSTEPAAMAMPITQAVPIGKHMSVPIRLPDGSVYGMFCCLGVEADRSLNERDMQMMKVFADLAAFEIGRDVEASKRAEKERGRITTIIEKQQIAIVYQPIWELKSPRPIGLESLCRFSAVPRRSPDKWFVEATQAGMGTSLEVAAIRQGLSVLGSLPLSECVAAHNFE